MSAYSHCQLSSHQLCGHLVRVLRSQPLCGHPVSIVNDYAESRFSWIFSQEEKENSTKPILLVHRVFLTRTKRFESLGTLSFWVWTLALSEAYYCLCRKINFLLRKWEILQHVEVSGLGHDLCISFFVFGEKSLNYIYYGLKYSSLSMKQYAIQFFGV